MARKKNLNTANETDEKAQEMGKVRKFTSKDLVSFRPKTPNQERFFELLDNKVQVLFQDGCAGTGKSAVALYSAMQDVFDDGPPEFHKIIIIRSAVDTRKQGFVPGEQEDKNAVYEKPYIRLASQLTKYKDAYSHMKNLDYLEFYTTAHLRGETFDNAVIIVDECQNADYDELSTIITRVGVHSRIIFCGDSKQDDLKRQREKSGFEKFKKVINSMPEYMIGFVEYTVEDVVRSGLVKEFLIADHNYSESA